VRRSLLALLVLLAACGGGDDGDQPASTTTSTPTATTVPVPTPEDLAAATCAARRVPGRVRISDPELVELSGLTSVGDVLWTHNDSGDEARVFALDQGGAVLAVVRLEGVTAVDWEDIASDGTDLFVGDIGDNEGVRDPVTVYRFAAPDPAGGDVTLGPDQYQAITLHYPGGPRDAEALLVDPVTRDLVIVHKRFGGSSEVYQAPEADWSDGEATLERVGTIDPGSTVLDAVTAGDVGANGQVVGIRTYARVLVWARDEGQSVAEALVHNAPCEAPVAVEVQGEALAFTPDGYVTVSEGAQPTLHRFRASA
jgi:hypothetical protein